MKPGYKLLIIACAIIAALFIFNAVYGFPGTQDPKETADQSVSEKA